MIRRQTQRHGMSPVRGRARALVHEVDTPKLTASHTGNLNDPHLTFMPAGWTLSTAEAVNEMGWIVGNGASPGHAQQGFVLIPQPLVTQ